jgi:thiamine biosynthesis lipoprotein
MEEGLRKSLPDNFVGHHRCVEAMGTRFDVFLGGQDEEHLEAVAVAILEEVVRLDGVFSRFDSRSEIARVNREAEDSPVRVDHEVFALLARCEQARETTEGYFDVTVLSASESPGPGMRLNAESRTVQITRPGAFIDLGGVGKGYALDRGHEIMQRFNVQTGLLQGGTSSVLAVGDGAWPIDLRHPQSPNLIAGRIELTGQALSCSAARHAGQLSSDIINPLTGEALAGQDACVVLAANATDAEGFSTGLLAMGRERARQFLKSHPDLEANVAWIEGDGRLHWFRES